jgi:asparagine synthase (glutamine-hydrolysing)
MCGILAVLSAPEDHVTPVESSCPSLDSVLERVRRIRHRGPDWSGVYQNKYNIIAHERLAIVDVDGGGQPMLSEDKKLILGVNGEIYNHKELETRQEYKYSTNSDCEVIMELYSRNKENPEEWLNKLNGIFAFVLLDTDGTYLIARDHMGIVPLYYGADAKNNLWISSELKAIHDVCKWVQEFPAGHFYNGFGTMIKWYNPKWYSPNCMPSSIGNTTELIREKLTDAIRRQLMSDVPYGILLSGGLDSSIIAAVASRICAKRIEDNGNSDAWYPRLHTFSIGLEGSPDLAKARIVADHIKSIHHELKFTLQEGLNALSDVIYHLETYDVTTIRAGTPMYLMARKIKPHGIKMVLSGEGSDEMFGGYLYFHKAPNREQMQLELVDKLQKLHQYDCLRANKAMMAFGIEARVPFLDREFLDFVMNEIDPADKIPRNNPKNIEKYLLRMAFHDSANANETSSLLPEEIVWRQKEQFSDAVGYNWIDTLKEHANTKITSEEFDNAAVKYPVNTPLSREAYLYREMFCRHFPSNSAALTVPYERGVACSTSRVLEWDAAFKGLNDPSGRVVQTVHNAPV